MAVTAEAHSRNYAVYLAVRRDLLLGRFQEGHRLKAHDIAATLNVSVSVVREALARLAEQGLIHTEPNKGYSVPEYTNAQIDDLAFVRKQVEGLALRLAVQSGDGDWETQVVATHYRLSITPSATPAEDPEANDRWSAAHRAFHAACAAGCGSPQLLAIREQLYDRSEIVRQLARLKSNAQRNAPAEHEAIMNALLARDADTAEWLIHEHIDRTRKAVLEARSVETTEQPAEAM